MERLYIAGSLFNEAEVNQRMYRLRIRLKEVIWEFGLIANGILTMLVIDVVGVFIVKTANI